MTPPTQPANAAAAERESWLCALTALPTAAGCEDAVIEWIERWISARPAAAMTRDADGNLLIRAARARDATTPLLFTAHLDHPAFVISEVSGGSVRAAFRGGVKTPYFSGARVVIHTRAGARFDAIVERAEEPDPDRACDLTISADAAGLIEPGDVGVWDLPAARIVDAATGGRTLEAPACDDLAAVAAALAAFDALLASGKAHERDVRLLLTRAEEIGFIGAIGACKRGAIPAGSRVIALENSRAFADSPLGAGPIVRVGDRMSVFSPALTASAAKAAQRLADKREGFRWQRRLMPGGACEASAYCAFGCEATCLCLPLENYHNMGDLERVEAQIKAGSPPASAPLKPERIHLDDFHNLVALLIAMGESLDAEPPLRERLERLYNERKGALERRSG